MRVILYLANQLHVTVLNTVVDHLDVVTGTLVADPLAAGLAIRLGRDGLEDVLYCCQSNLSPLLRNSHLDVWPGLLVTTRHDAGAITGTLLTTRDTASNETDTLASQVFCAAVGIGIVRVSTVDDDVTLFNTALVDQELNEVVDRLASHDEHHHASGLLELLDELLDGVCADNGLALGLCFISALYGSMEKRRILPSFKNRSTLATLFGLSVCAPKVLVGRAYVLLNATTWVKVSAKAQPDLVS